MQTTLDPALPVAPAAPLSRLHGELALLFQEAFTVANRVRSNRQVAADGESFRAHVKQLLATADRDARQSGYSGDTVRLAVYAYVAFLDESVLNSSQPMFSAWPRQPLQEEIFGEHIAGENFFRYLDELLARQDSEELADLLEVYLLCLLLGFRGRYGASGRSGTEAVISTAGQKIARIRGPLGPLAPTAALRPEPVPVHRDRWIPRLLIIAGVSLLSAMLLFVAFRFSLGSDLEQLRSTVDGFVAG